MAEAVLGNGADVDRRRRPDAAASGRDARSTESAGFVPPDWLQVCRGNRWHVRTRTSAIAIAIQKEIGLTVDGKVGLNTRAAETTSVT